MKSILIALLCLSGFSGLSQTAFDPQSAIDFQQELNIIFGDPEKSPLLEKDLRSFSELDFFAVDSTYHVIARVERTPEAQPFKMLTSTHRLPEYVQYATLHFTLRGTECKLNLYRNVELTQKSGYEDYLFLPFSDLTNFDQTYIGGRYIDVKVPEGDTMAIDFNKAYNPYCAYNYGYSCPKVPMENDLPVAIYAGVKKFHD